jgi:hypothetical protein
MLGATRLVNTIKSRRIVLRPSHKIHLPSVLPTSKPFGPVLVKPGTRPGGPSGQAWWGAPYAQNSVDLVVTGIDHSRSTPEQILPGFPVLSIYIYSLRLYFLVWTLLSIVTAF